MWLYNAYNSHCQSSADCTRWWIYGPVVVLHYHQPVQARFLRLTVQYGACTSQQVQLIVVKMLKPVFTALMMVALYNSKIKQNDYLAGQYGLFKRTFDPPQISVDTAFYKVLLNKLPKVCFKKWDVVELVYIQDSRQWFKQNCLCIHLATVSVNSTWVISGNSKLHDST